MQELSTIDIPHERPRLALELPVGTSFDDWVAIGRRLCLGSQAINWHIGDWWNFGIKHWGENETRSKALEIWGREGETARKCGWVALKFEPVRRRTNLPFSHYHEVAGLEPAKAHNLLEQAERERWSTRDIRSHIAGKRKEDRDASPLNQYPVREKVPTIAEEIEEEAARVGELLTDFIAMLIGIGWQHYLAERGDVAQAA